MTYRNALLLGFSAIALQGCIAAAAVPIVAGSGALVRSGVSDDARPDRQETVTLADPAPIAEPATDPAAEPAPALAVAEPEAPVAPAPAPVAQDGEAPEPVVVATLANTPAALAAESPAQAASQPAPEEAPALAAMPAVEGPAAPEAAPPSQAVVAAQLPEEPVAAPSPEQPSLATVDPDTARIADIGLPPDPAAAGPEPQAALAAAVPVEEPVAEEARAPARPELPPAAEEPASQAAFASARPSVEPPAGVSAEMAMNQPIGEGYASLRDYAMRTLGGGLPLPSAMLADPTSLQPDRRDCQGNTPTVVIDIDPAGGLVPLVGPLSVNNELARVLAELRLRDVQIAWITDRGPIDARAVRDRLVAAGLDTEGQDSLYVERYPGETKQARRAALAQTQCVIALAGDERSDFDDLYNFIIDQNDAGALEAMFGNGWFLIDNPVGE